MKNGKQFILIIISLIYVSLCIVAIFREDIVFPFVQYQMFHRLTPEPVTTLYQLYAVDKKGVEHFVKKNLIRPMSIREAYEIYNFVPIAVRDALTKYTISQGHKSFPEYPELRLYETTCSCLNYYKMVPAISMHSYSQNHCERRLLSREQYLD